MAYNANMRRDCKAVAKAAIRERFWPTMAAAVLTGIPLLLISMILNVGTDGLTSAETITADMVYQLLKYTGLWALVYFFVGSPLIFGAKHYYVARARGRAVPVSVIFGVFGSMRTYLTSLKLALSILVRSLVWFVLAYAVILGGLVPFAFLEGGLLTVWMLVYIAAVIAVGLLADVKISRFDGAYICMIDNPNASTWKATGACARIFRGHNWELLVFELSFLGWIILGVLTIGVVYLYYTAYHDIAFTQYFDALCKKN